MNSPAPVTASRFSPAFLRLLLLLGAGGLALYAGFARFDPDECARLVRLTGYWWALALVAGAVASFAWCIRETGPAQFWQAIRPGRGHALFLALLSVWVLALDRPGQKILFDEPMLSATALTMHQERELGAVTRAYPLPGVFTILRTHLDKRPPLFPFLVASAHDLTGFRTANAIYVNMAATVALLWLVWLLGRRYGGSPAAGSVAAALLATFPQLGVSASAAGMDQVNLLLLAGTWWTALAYLDRPGRARAMLLVFAVLLLTYSRYESVLYVAAAGFVWLTAARRRGQWLPETAWAILPLGLMLYAWHNTVLSHSPEQWELRAEQTARFSLGYLAHNLRHAANFFFVPNWAQPNSVPLSLAGLAGGAALILRALRGRSTMEPNSTRALVAFGAVITAAFALLMCYYWAELDDPIVTRLSLPFHLLLTILAVSGWREFAGTGATARGWRAPAVAVGAATVILTVPAAALARYSETNLMRKNVEWQQRVAAAQSPAPGLVISNRSPLVWLAGGIPAISADRARLRGGELHWHLQRHSFGTILVMQRLLSSGQAGGWSVDPLDQLPADWKMEEVAVHRFGDILMRVSRLDEVPAAPASVPAPTTVAPE